MISVYNVNLAFGSQNIFDNLNVQINNNDRIGLIGKNGAGKTTFFRLISGQIKPDSGSITFDKSIRISYLPQEQILNSNENIIDFIRHAFDELNLLKEELDLIMKEIGILKDEEEITKRLNRMGYIQSYLEIHNYYAQDTIVYKVLKGLGFSEEDFKKKIHQFSGGWQTRLFLAKLLVNPGDLLLLDEPTNHLDINSIIWLENYLKEYEGALIIISHDRDFLNNIVNEIWYLNFGRVYKFQGGYDDFLVKWKEYENTLEKKIKNINKKEQELLNHINKFRAKARHAANVQSKIKLLEKLQEEKPELVKDSFDSKIKFKLPDFEKSGSKVLEVENVSKFYGDKLIFSGLSFEILAGDKIVLSGPNGHGKSTLTRLICGEEEPSEGVIKLGHNVKIAYFSQDSNKRLNLNNTVYEELYEGASVDRVPYIRAILGAFLFSGDSVNKKVSVLSGGEKTRLVFAKMFLKDANFLVLDEPTNYLDIPSKEALLNALINFPGTILLVTHDRYFIKKFAEKIFYLENKKMIYYPGNYDDFIFYINNRLSAGEKGSLTKVKSKDNNKNYKKELRRERAQIRQMISGERKKLTKKIKECEEKIEYLENRLKDIESQLYSAEIYSDPDKAAALNKEYKKLKPELEEYYNEWDKLQHSLERLLSILD